MLRYITRLYLSSVAVALGLHLTDSNTYVLRADFLRFACLAVLLYLRIPRMAQVG